jgi:Zn-finger nucleic acid-binding protein
MRRIERSGVVIDRCNNCGGVFLDRGELEHLVQAENAYVARTGSRYDDDDDDDDDDRRRHYDPSYDRGREGNMPPGKRKKSRRGFLEDLLDFG